MDGDTPNLSSTNNNDDKIFQNIKFYVAGDVPEKIIEILQSRGAEKHMYLSDYVTHMICGLNASEDDISSAKELYEIPAVRWKWVSICSNSNKLVNTKGFIVSETNLFFKMVFCFSKISKEDCKVLWAMITFYGGEYQPKLTPACTHLVAIGCEGEKYEKASTLESIKIVTPDWIIESIKSKMLVQYELYHPRLLIKPPPTPPPPKEEPIIETIEPQKPSEQNTQVLLDQLKQRMPWNQQQTTQPNPVVSEIDQLRSQQNVFSDNSKLLNSGNQQFSVSMPQSQFNNQMIQSTMAGMINSSNQITSVQSTPITQQTVSLQNQQNSFRTQQSLNTIQQQLSQQHIQAGLQRQHMLQTSIAQQQLTSQNQDQNEMSLNNQNKKIGNNVMHPSDNNFNQMQQKNILQQNITMNKPNLIMAQQNQALINTKVQQILNNNLQQQQILGSGNVLQHQQQIGQPKVGPPNQMGGLQRLPTNQIQRQQILNTQQAAVFKQQQQQPLISANQQGDIANNEAMLKQQRLLQQQQQLRIQQLQNAVGNQQGGGQLIMQQLQGLRQNMPKPQQGVPQNQFVQPQGQQRPIGWQQQQMAPQQQITQQQLNQQQLNQQQITQQQLNQQQITQQQLNQQQLGQQQLNQQQLATQQLPNQTQLNQQMPQQQIFLQHRQQGQGNIQRPPNWPQGQPQPGLPQRHLIHLDAETNAQLQQMNPQQRALFVARLQKQNQLLMQRQVIQQQHQFAVIRGQVVPGQTQGAQWQQAGARPPTLVVQQNPVTPQGTPIRLPQKPDEIPTTPGVVGEQSPLIVNAKTKTALANMLSIRLQSGGTPVDTAAVNEPSAAGTLRLMTAQHNAALQQQQQRRALSNGTPVMPPAVPQGAPIVRPVVPPQPQPAAPRAHFYGHNPNLKLPPSLFLLGCVFVVVEVEHMLDVQVPNWRTLIRKYGGEIESIYCQRVTIVLCQSQKHGVVMQALRDSKRCVTVYWLYDALKRKQVLPPSMAIHLPTLYPDESPGARHLISTSGFNEQEKIQVKLMIENIGARYTNYFSKHNTVLICSKPEGAKYNFARKCGIPIVNVQWLSDIMMGNLTALHQLEHARYSHFNIHTMFGIDYNLNAPLMHGWKMPINITQESYERVKRNAPPPSAPKPKKMKPDGSLPAVPRDGAEPRVLFSQVVDVEILEAIVGRLGGSVATSAKTATHLVMPKLSRSYKLLQCIAKGTHIVPDSWVKDSGAANKFVDETNHTFSNVEEFNSTFNCDFNKIFTYKERDKLFQNRTFYLTPSVCPSRNVLKEMIEFSGGVVESRRKSYSQIEENNTKLPQSYIILTHKDDLHLINDCLVSANSGKKSIVFNTEFVLSGILKQQLLFDENKFAVTIVTKKD